MLPLSNTDRAAAMPNGLTSARLPHASREVYRGERVWMALLCVLAASGSLVFIEPAPYDILAILMLVGLLATGLRLPIEIRPHLLLLALFIVCNVIAAAGSTDPLLTLRSLSVRVYLPLTWLLVVCLVLTDTRRMLSALWIGYIVAAVFAVGWGALEYFGILNVDWLRGDNAWYIGHNINAIGAGLRARGAFKDPNVFGPFLVPVAVYAASRIVHGRRLQRVLFVGLLLLFLFGILLSFSRGAWINCTFSLLLFAFLAYRNAISAKERLAGLALATVSLVAILSLLGGVLSFGTIADRFYQRAVLEQEYDVASGGRFDTQRKTLIEIGTHPIGVGPAMSREAFGLEPHNMYLHVLVEAGWIGGLSFIGFVGLIGVGIARAARGPSPLQKEAVVLLSALSGLLAQTPFIDSTHWRHMWLLFALCAALTIAIRRDRFEDRIKFVTETPRLGASRSTRPTRII